MFGFGSGNTADATIRVNYHGEGAVKGLQQLKGAFTTIVSALALKQLAEFTYKLGEVGAQSELVGKNFERIAGLMGRSSTDMMTKLRAATMGMVDDMTLQQNAMKAMIGGVKFEDVLTSMEYVTKFATATGISVSEKMTTVMTGLARGSAAFLDDVGIQVMGAKDVVGAAMTQMKEKMGTFATSEDDAATKAARLKAELTNLRNEIGQELVPAFNWINEVILDTLMGWKQLASSGDILRATLKSVVGVLLPIINVSMKEGDKTLLDKLFGDIGTKNTELDSLIKKNEELAEAIQQRNFLVGEIAAAEAAGIDRVFMSAEKNAQMTVARAELWLDDLNRKIGVLGPTTQGPTKEPFAKPKPAGDKKKDTSIPGQSFREELFDAELAHWLDVKEEELKAQEEADGKIGLSTEEMVTRRKEILQELRIAEVGEARATLDEKLAILQQDLANGVITAEEATQLRKAAEKEYADYAIEQEKKVSDKRKENFSEMISSAQQLASALITYSNAYTDREIRNVEELYKQKLISQDEYDARVASIQEENKERSETFARAQQAIIIARAISDAIAAGIGAAKDTPGGAVTKILSMGAMIATAMLEVATIEAQTFAKGTRSSQEGPAWVGEEGPELVYLPRGSEVKTNAESRRVTTPRGDTVNNFYGLSTEQVIAIQRNNARRSVTGTLI